MFTRTHAIRFKLRALAAAMFPLFAVHGVEEEIAALKDSITKLEAKNTELVGENRKLKRGAEIDPEDLSRAERERDEWKGKAETATRDLKKATTDLEAANVTLKGEQGYTQKLLVDNGLMAALTEVGVKNPVNLKAALALIRANNAAEVKVEGDTRAALIGGKPLAEFVKTWAASEDGKHFVAAPVNSGVDAKGNQTTGIPVTPATAALKPVDRMHAAREATAAAAKT
jgi:hypothetical protein